jgi:hypothetical protein
MKPSVCFNGDITGFIRPEINYDGNKAWKNVKNLKINFI